MLHVNITHCAGYILANANLQRHGISHARQPICVSWSQTKEIIATSQVLQAHMHALV